MLVGPCHMIPKWTTTAVPPKWGNRLLVVKGWTINEEKEGSCPLLKHVAGWVCLAGKSATANFFRLPSLTRRSVSAQNLNVTRGRLPLVRTPHCLPKWSGSRAHAAGERNSIKIVFQGQDSLHLWPWWDGTAVSGLHLTAREKARKQGPLPALTLRLQANNPLLVTELNGLTSVASKCQGHFES